MKPNDEQKMKTTQGAAPKNEIEDKEVQLMALYMYSCITLQLITAHGYGEICSYWIKRCKTCIIITSHTDAQKGITWQRK